MNGLKAKRYTNMDKLMPISEWRKFRFTHPPSLSTIKRWCEQGQLPSKKIGGTWYIDYQKELKQTGDESVDSILGVN